MKRFILWQRHGKIRSWTVAAYHSPHSLTWRWALYFNQHVAPAWPRLWGHINNTGVCCGVRVPFIGVFDFRTQTPMWYRDMYNRQAAIMDAMREEIYTANKAIVGAATRLDRLC